MKIRSLAGLAAAAALVAPATALAGPTVTVRVEGETQTLLERTRVTLPDTPPPGGNCKAGTPGAALEVATNGNWDRQALTQTILGETHKFDNSDYWAEWLDRGGGYRYGNGVCNDLLNTGDDVVLLVDRSPGPSFLPTVFPLAIEGLPTTVRRGTPVTLTVVEYRTPTGTPGEGVRAPVAGASINLGSTTVTTGGDGRASVTFDTVGTAALKATRAGNAPSPRETVTVNETGTVLPTPDTTAPVAAIAGIRDGQRFSRRRAPRVLRGTVSEDASGLWAVKIRLTRRLGKTCWYFSGTRERFLKRTCGKKFAFKVGDRTQWQYLLPARLPRGRYLLETYAIDNAFNHGPVQRVRFRVR